MFDWVSHLPNEVTEFERVPEVEVKDLWTVPKSMSKLSPSKRLRSDSESSQTSDPGTGTTLSRQGKGGIYEDHRYQAVMETKGSFSRDSEHGPLPEELELLEILQTRKEGFSSVRPQLLPREILGQVREMLRNRSELRVCIELHPHLVPSAEKLEILHPDQIKHLTEGHNDRWLDNEVFYLRLPQPDRTLAFSLSAFSDVERRKLKFSPGTLSPFAACYGALFPFFTAEVKCGRASLEVADNANLNSMSIALRAVFDLYHQVGQASRIHRHGIQRNLETYDVSHDDEYVRIYGHYPEINGDTITFYRKLIRSFSCIDNNAQEGETSARFLWNVYTYFAPLHLKRIKEVISEIPEPCSLLVTSLTASQTLTISEDDDTPQTPVTSNSGPSFAKPELPQRRVTVKQLQAQMQQRDEQLAQMQQQMQQVMASLTPKAAPAKDTG